MRNAELRMKDDKSGEGAPDLPRNRNETGTPGPE